MPDRMIGLLALDGSRVDGPGSMFDPAVIGPAVLPRVVAGATTAAIIADPAALTVGYRAAAEDVVAGGAGLVVSNCGLSMVFQSDVVSATGRPTLMSSLLLLPLLVRVFGGGIGVLTYEAGAMAAPRLRAECGWEDGFDVHVADVRDLPSWRALEGPADVPLDEAAMRDDLLRVTEGLIARGGDRAILVECTAMLPLLDELRARFPVPFFDIAALTDFVGKEVSRAGA